VEVHLLGGRERLGELLREVGSRKKILTFNGGKVIPVGGMPPFLLEKKEPSESLGETDSRKTRDTIHHSGHIRREQILTSPPA